MASRASIFIGLAVAAAVPAHAQDKFTQDKPAPIALFDLTLDLDSDGKMDRAVLVNPGGKDAGFFSSDKAWFMFGADDRADLYVYLGGGDAPLDITHPPSFIKTGLVTGDRYNQVYPLESAGPGSLRVKSAYSLYSNFKEETLSIVHRKGEFLVAGLTIGFEWKNGDMGNCDINFLTGKGVASKGLNGRKKAVSGKFAPVKLAAWSAKNYPKACRF